MIDRRRFLQFCSSAVSAVSVSTHSRARSLSRPWLFSPDTSTDALPTATDEAFHVERQIKIIGVGGCGSNTVHYLIARGVPGVEYICANKGTDVQNRCSSHKVIPLCRNRQPIGEQLDRSRITSELADGGFRSSIEGTDTLYIVAGMGGRTGTQAAPEMARIARSIGILTVAVVTMPFDFEVGRKRYAGAGVVELKANVDSLIVISNDRLMEILGEDVTQEEVFTYGYDLVKTAIDIV